ncbi:MAG: hypothetical protein ACJ796_06700 [Gemmatimonadaceae bacterium]
MPFGKLWWGMAACAAPILGVAQTLGAQMPGSPVLQNAWANPGLTAAFNFSHLSGASSYAGAVAWSPGSARFQLSGGVGAQTRSNSSTSAAYGVRLNVPVIGATSSLGVSLFAGYGAISGGTIDSSVTKALIPIGATVGFRKAIGETHGLSIYASPVYEAVNRGGGASNVGIFRGDVGLDVGITSAIGLTLGVEFGGSQPQGSGKPSGTAFGGAISYAIGSHR